MFRLFEYLYWSLRYPRHKDFINMGLGIQARYERSKRYWQKHIDLAISFQREFFESIFEREGSSEERSVAILGAGRLLDTDPLLLKQYFKKLSLYDADPRAIKYCERKAGAYFKNGCLYLYCCDVTSVIDVWDRRLAATIQKTSATDLTPIEDLLKDLCNEFRSPPPLDLSSPDCCISLNLLSQIPIYWRDRFWSRLERKGIDIEKIDRPQRDSISTLLYNTCTLLQEHHLNVLLKSGAKSVIIITDTTFFTYTKDDSLWQEEEAIPADLLSEPLIKEAGYVLEGQSSWLWHIAPQHIEYPDHGEIHQVHALALVMCLEASLGEISDTPVQFCP